MQTSPEEKFPLYTHGLLLIDEVALHLHPAWQRELRQFLNEKLPNLQIVATTHSPLAAQQAEMGELFILRRPAPKKSPVLEPFIGTPSDFLVQELITGSAFDIPTINSAKMERVRERYISLRDKKDRTDSEQMELEIIKEQLVRRTREKEEKENG